MHIPPQVRVTCRRTRRGRSALGQSQVRRRVRSFHRRSTSRTTIAPAGTAESLRGATGRGRAAGSEFPSTKHKRSDNELRCRGRTSATDNRPRENAIGWLAAGLWQDVHRHVMLRLAVQGRRSAQAEGELACSDGRSIGSTRNQKTGDIPRPIGPSPTDGTGPRNHVIVAAAANVGPGPERNRQEVAVDPAANGPGRPDRVTDG